MFEWMKAMFPWNWKWVQSLKKRLRLKKEPIGVSPDWKTEFLLITLPLATPDSTKNNPENSDGHKIEDEQTQPYPFTTIALAIFAAFAVMFMVNAVLFFAYPNSYYGVRVWHLVFLLQLVYILSSFTKVPESKKGAIILFGKPIYNVSSGLVFVPPFITELLIVQEPAIQHELPAEPQFIWRGEGTLPPDLAEKGYREPLRAVFKRSDSHDRGPLEEQLTTEYKVVSTWHISDFCRFIGKVGSIDEGRKRIEDVEIAFCSDRLAKSTLLQSLSSLEEISNELRAEVEELVKDWGVKIESVQLKQIPLSHGLNAAIETASIEAGRARGKVAEAKGIRDSKVLVAEGTRKATELEGEGEGAAEKARLIGTTDGMVHMQSELKVQSDQVLAAHVARAVASHDGQTFVFGADGFGQLFTLAHTMTQEGRLPKNQNLSTGS